MQYIERDVDNDKAISNGNYVIKRRRRRITRLQYNNIRAGIIPQPLYYEYTSNNTMLHEIDPLTVKVLKSSIHKNGVNDKRTSHRTLPSARDVSCEAGEGMEDGDIYTYTNMKQKEAFLTKDTFIIKQAEEKSNIYCSDIEANPLLRHDIEVKTYDECKDYIYDTSTAKEAKDELLSHKHMEMKAGYNKKNIYSLDDDVKMEMKSEYMSSTTSQEEKDHQCVADDSDDIHGNIVYNNRERSMHRCIKEEEKEMHALYERDYVIDDLNRRLQEKKMKYEILEKDHHMLQSKYKELYKHYK